MMSLTVSAAVASCSPRTRTVTATIPTGMMWPIQKPSAMMSSCRTYGSCLRSMPPMLPGSSSLRLPGLLMSSRRRILSSPRMPMTMTGYCPARQSHRWPSCHAVTLTATRCSSRTMMTVSVPPCAMSPERPMSSTLTATACKAVTMTHSSISTTNIPTSSGTPLTPSSVAESARTMPLPSARR